MARKLYGSVKYLDDFTACRIEEQSSTPAAVTSVNSSTLATWAKTRTNFTTAIGSGKELDYILVDLYPLGGSYHCDFGFAFEDGTNVSDRMFSDSTISGLAATVLSETGVTISNSVTTLQASLIYPTATYTHESKKIVKLYGSVNGQTKEIKKFYGSAEVPAYVSSQPQMTADQGMGQYIDQSAFDLSKLGDAIAAGGGQTGTYYQMNIWYVTSQGGFGIWVGNPGTIIMQTGLSRAALAEYGVTTNATPSTDTGNAEFRVSIQQNGTKSVTKLLLDNS